MNMDKQKSKIGGMNLLFLIFFSILFILIRSISTSPFYQGPFDKDSAIFQTIGKYWISGVIPYSQLFDHKGALIFFIDAMGYLFTGNRYGIAIIQMIFMSISAIIIYSFYQGVLSERIKSVADSMDDKLIFHSFLENRAAFICTIVTLLLITASYEEGNLTEEYILPFIFYCIILLITWVDSGMTSKIHIKIPFWYGITFGISIMTRVTNALGVCMIVFVISIYLIVEKRFAELLNSVLSFVAGCLVITLPFIIYFGINGSLYDFLWASIIYNLSYAESAKGDFFSGSIRDVLECLLRMSPCVVLAILGLFYLVKKNYVKFSLYFFTGSIMTFLFVKSHRYYHYYMIAVPLVLIIFYEYKIIKGEFSNLISLHVFQCFCITTIVMMTLLSSRWFYKGYLWATDTKGYHPASDVLISNVPNDEFDSVMAYNCERCFYLDNNIVPGCKFFIFQDWQGSSSEKLTNMIREEYLQKEIKWILVRDEATVISDILDKYYNEYVSQEIDEHIYKLYKIKE